MVELGQVRHRDAHGADRLRLHGRRQRRWCIGLASGAHAQQQRFDVVAGLGPARLDGALDLVDRVLVEQLQHAHVVLGAALRSMLPFQRLTQVAENGGQMPATQDRSMIERRRPALQRIDVMRRIEDLFVPAVTARMRRDHLGAEHHVDAFDVRFDRHGLKRRRTRHAVAIGVEAHHLVLVRLGRLNDARIERTLGK